MVVVPLQDGFVREVLLPTPNVGAFSKDGAKPVVLRPFSYLC